VASETANPPAKTSPSACAPARCPRAPCRDAPAAHCGTAGRSRPRRRPGRGRLGIAESLRYLSHQDLASWKASSLAMRPHDGPVELAAKRPSMTRTIAGAVVGPRDSGQQRSITGPSGQPQPQVDSRIGRDRSSGPYMACKEAAVDLAASNLPATAPRVASRGSSSPARFRPSTCGDMVKRRAAVWDPGPRRSLHTAEATGSKPVTPTV
jgi:hypothetical protein